MSSFLKSFVYAFRGLGYCLVNERNMRVHFCCLAYMVFFLVRYDFFVVTRTQAAILAVAAALVIVAEYINTAVERAVDTASKGEKTETARIAKDTAAGAVLAAAIFAVVTGIIILYQPEAFRALFAYYAENPISLVLFIVSFIIAICFMFTDPKRYLKISGRK
ncbi:MAG: diacylglycerol kinase family protein [Clostridia bacterium]|nr:diacylglycerol kinase family protein [Clostridia bacterium]MBR6634588.1 diacylglycerol kinase family protein [Clostridia bacterium]